MNENKVIRNRLLAETVIKGLKSRHMNGYYAETKEDALKMALDMIPTGSTIGWGGSMSIAEIGLKKAVLEGDYTVYDRTSAKDMAERKQIDMKVYGSDVYLTSTNAITEDKVGILGFYAATDNLPVVKPVLQWIKQRKTQIRRQ